MPASLIILTVISYLSAVIAIPVIAYSAVKTHNEGQGNSILLLGLIVNVAYLFATTAYLLQGVFINNQLSEVFRMVHTLWAASSGLSALHIARLSQQVPTCAPDKQTIASLVRDIRRHDKAA